MNLRVKTKLFLKAVLIGGAFGCLYRFLFPGVAISTLIHGTLGLPGPGTGVALILGPLAALACMLAYSVFRKRGTALAASVGLALFNLILPGTMISQAGISLFLPAAGQIVVGVTCEIVVFYRPLKTWTLLLAGVLSSWVITTYYSVAIFPGWKGWIAPKNIPVLVLLGAVGGALLCGGIGSLLLLFTTLSNKGREE